MTCNPILHNTFVRLHHILLCVLLGISYAISMGCVVHVSALGITVDAMASMVLFFDEAVVLWNVFTFSRLEVLESYQSMIIHIAYAIVAVLFMLVVEYFIIAVFSSNDMNVFVTSLPARAFALIVMYAFYRRYYANNKVEDDNEEIVDSQDFANKEQRVQPVEVIERITVKVGTKIKVIPVDDIICLKAGDDYVSVITADGHWLKSERLKDFEAMLPDHQFARVHRSYIVNMGKISKIERYGQKQMLLMNDGEQIRISMTGYKVLREKLHL